MEISQTFLLDMVVYYSHTYHGQKDTELWIHINFIAIRENKHLLPLFLAREHNVNLLSGHGQYR